MSKQNPESRIVYSEISQGGSREQISNLSNFVSASSVLSKIERKSTDEHAPWLEIPELQFAKGPKQTEHKIIELRESNNKRTLIVESSERRFSLKYNEKGELYELTSPYGEVFDKKNGRWTSRTNLVQPDGVQLSEDKQHNVTIRDNKTGISTTYNADGREIIESCGGKAIRTFHGNNATVDLQSPGSAPRKLEFEIGKLARYIDRNGDVYTKSGADWTCQDAQGNKTDFSGVVKEDGTGNVFIINSSRKGNDDHVVVHELNGAITKGNQERTCQTLEKTPLNINLSENIRRAEGHRPAGPFTARQDQNWFIAMVTNKGSWDYKQLGPQYQDFGNFHFGVMAAAIGFPLTTSLREAGRRQVADGTSKPEWGHPGSKAHSCWDEDSKFLSTIGFDPGKPPYGDDPKDQEQIKRGYQYYLDWKKSQTNNK